MRWAQHSARRTALRLFAQRVRANRYLRMLGCRSAGRRALRRAHLTSCHPLYDQIISMVLSKCQRKSFRCISILKRLRKLMRTYTLGAHALERHGCNNFLDGLHKSDYFVDFNDKDTGRQAESPSLTRSRKIFPLLHYKEQQIGDGRRY